MCIAVHVDFVLSIMHWDLILSRVHVHIFDRQQLVRISWCVELMIMAIRNC